MNLDLAISLSILTSLIHFSAPQTTPDYTAYDARTGKIQLVQVIWTEGTHAPDRNCPTSPYNESNSFYPGYGELLPKGMLEQFTLGQKIRQRYAVDLNFLSKTFKSSELYVKSANVNRTIASAISNFYGFFAPSAVAGASYPNSTKWPKRYVPTPIRTTKFDYTFDTDTCPIQMQLAQLLANTTEYNAFQLTFQSYFQTMSSLCGLSLTTLSDFQMMVDALIAEEALNLQMTPDMRNALPQAKVYANSMLKFKVGMSPATDPAKNTSISAMLAKAKGGPLLTELVVNMENKYDNYLNDTAFQYMAPTKYVAYSAKTEHLMALMSTFGINKSQVYNDTVITSATSVIVELWVDDNDNTDVKVLYLPFDANGLVDMTTKITGCSTGCTLEKFVNRSMPYYWDSMSTYCNSKL